jgi:hypothetical protein
LKLKQGTNKFINVIREKIKEKYPNLSGDMQKLVEKHLVNEVIKNPDVQKHLKYLLGQFQNLDKILEFLSTSASPIGAELSGSSKELRNKIDEIIKDYKLNEEELSRNKKEVVKSLERIMRDLDANMS